METGAPRCTWLNSRMGDMSGIEGARRGTVTKGGFCTPDTRLAPLKNFSMPELRWCMHLCPCVLVFVSVRGHACVHVCISVCAYMCVLVCVHVCMYVHARTHPRICTCVGSRATSGINSHLPPYLRQGLLLAEAETGLQACKLLGVPSLPLLPKDHCWGGLVLVATAGCMGALRSELGSLHLCDKGFTC